MQTGAVSEKCVELRGLEPLAFWMQTTGAALLTTRWCSSARVLMPAQDSRSAHGLLYLAAVQGSQPDLPPKVP